MLTTKRTLWSALERVGLWEAYQQQGAQDASESSRRFGVRWDPAVDLLKLPDGGGVAILFYPHQRFQVAATTNLFRHIHQCYRAPGMSVRAFSWLAVEHPLERHVLNSRLLKMKPSGSTSLSRSCSPTEPPIQPPSRHFFDASRCPLYNHKRPLDRLSFRRNMSSRSACMFVWRIISDEFSYDYNVYFIIFSILPMGMQRHRRR